MHSRTRQLPRPPFPGLLCRLLFRENITTYSSRSGPLKTREARGLQETWTHSAAQGQQAALLVFVLFYFVLFCFITSQAALGPAGEFHLEAGN